MWSIYFLEGMFNLNFYLNLFSVLLLCLLALMITSKGQQLKLFNSPFPAKETSITYGMV